MFIRLAIALGLSGGYDDRETSFFTFDLSRFDGEDVFA